MKKRVLLTVDSDLHQEMRVAAARPNRPWDPGPWRSWANRGPHETGGDRSVAFFTYSHERYEPTFFGSGEQFGTPGRGARCRVGALDRVNRYSSVT